MDVPPAATLVLSLVNSRAAGDYPERLADGPGLHEWIRQNSPVPAPALVTDADAAAARELRAALHTLLLAHAGQDDPEGVAAAEEHLHRFGRSHPLSVVVTAADVHFTPNQDGVAGQFAAVLAALGDLARQGTWARVKACRNPPCQFAFYDRTRNLSGRYCNPRTCGAQTATRSYRARKDQSLLDRTDVRT
jgi:predicted RNA-binding Zn ribbon-like protein